jgi:hypothetical protein
LPTEYNAGPPEGDAYEYGSAPWAIVFNAELDAQLMASVLNRWADVGWIIKRVIQRRSGDLIVVFQSDYRD